MRTLFVILGALAMLLVGSAMIHWQESIKAFVSDTFPSSSTETTGSSESVVDLGSAEIRSLID